MKALMTGRILLFDNDGVLAPAGGNQPEANDPPPVLKNVLKKAAVHNRIIILSGQPLGVIESMRDKLGIPSIILAPDYGSYLVNGDKKEFLVSGHALEMLRRADELVSPMMWTLGGNRDKRKAIGLFTFFWEKREQWLEAKEKLEALNFGESFLFKNGLRIQWNVVDFSANILPMKAGKSLVVKKFQNKGIIVGAGDTCSDMPLMDAVFPIVAHDNGMEAHPCLLGALERKGGIGYIAPPGESYAHGYGTAAGIERAAELGYVRL